MNAAAATNLELPRLELERLSIMAEASVHRGDFELTHGSRVEWYIDGRDLLMSAPSALLIGQLLCGLLEPDLTCVGGPATAALPVVSAIVHQSPVRVKGFYVRGDHKEHGLMRRIEGQLESRVAVVDDTCSTGQTLLECIRTVEEAGSVVEQVLTVFDRGHGGDALRERGYDYRYVLRLEDGRAVLPCRE